MQSIKRRVTVSGLILVLVLSVFAVHQTLGARGAFARPTTVVAVDLAAVLDGLQQRSVAEAELKQMGAELAAEEQRRVEELQALRQRREEAPEADHATLDEQLDRAMVKFEAWRQLQLERVDQETALRWQALDRSVRKAIAEMAEVEGYDIVLTDDSSVELGLNPALQASRENQIRQQMSARRLLYLNPEVDITDELIERMNNAFSAGG
jgi:Skp family chaperone for outer membrane proteins